jgi:hypothetical protein
MAKMTTLHLRCTCVASPVALLLATQKPVALHTVSLRHVCCNVQGAALHHLRCTFR